MKGMRGKQHKGKGQVSRRKSSRIIRNFRLFWSADKVEWGEKRKGNGGKLLGRLRGDARGVDFREQFGVYALYANYKLIYIGQKGGKNEARLFNRLREHHTGRLAGRWDHFSWFGMRAVTRKNEVSSKKNVAVHAAMRESVSHLEAIAITIAEPPLNLQRGSWGQAKQYYQCPKDEAADE